MLKAVSGYVWQLHCISETAILNYQPSLLPRTHSHTQPDCTWGQLTHVLLARTLSGLLSCQLEHRQKSELRSVLRLGVVFFIRGCNAAGIVVGLRCLQFLNGAAAREEGEGEKGDSQICITNMLRVVDSLEQILEGSQ